MSDEVAIRAAANRLGITEWAVRKAVLRGELKELPGPGPARLDADEVDRFRRARQTAALARIGARGTDLVQLARDARSFLRPYPGAPTSGKVSSLGADVVAAFGAAALHAAAVREGCGWCAAAMAARLLGTEPPAYGTAMLALLGEPCAKDMKRFAGAEMERLRAQVHPGGTPPAAARTAPVTAAGSMAPPVPPVQRPRSAQSQDDTGKTMVAARLRETRARLKSAKRSGDQRRAIELRRMIQSLEADAARVDGRPAVTASAARPGTLRCGHALAAGCSCPRRASRREQR
ncbi:hypothetical protein [Streptomyces ureilyticus]|uniref:Helix-turn-helix domain-containing protein n=1 Tax=Streptomyces ureilyticus TaxID=1775131 RepID=A0ABX0DPI1_9ACTN|nr:hypothetical protein [Streptomyces ureilyticus]NGO43783.1 hypothetical protein [Streptomyces ureilyticus]